MTFELRVSSSSVLCINEVESYFKGQANYNKFLRKKKNYNSKNFFVS